MNNIHKQIGQIIRNKREAKKMTQLQLAQALGYDSTQFVSLFDRGMSKVPLNVIGKCAKVLGFNPKSIEKLLLNDFKTNMAEQIGEGML